MSIKTVPWIRLPDPPAALEIDARRYLEEAAAYEITSPEIREAATIDLVAIKKMADGVEAKRKEITVPLDNAKKAVMALFAPLSDLLTDAKRVLEQKILLFDRKIEAERRAAQEAQEQAARAERARLEEAARKAAASGQTIEAEVLAEAATLVAAAPVVVEPLAGATQTRTTWSAELVDMRALARAVGEGTVPVEWLSMNAPIANAHARARRSEDIGVPGVRGVARQSLAAGRGGYE